MTSQSSSSNVTPTTDSSSSSSRSNVTPTTESSRTAPQQQPPSPGQEGQAASVPQPMVRELLAKASGYYGCDLDTFITILSGSVSGVAATFAKQPIQRVKWIRQVHEGHAKPYTSIVKDTVRFTRPHPLYLSPLQSPGSLTHSRPSFLPPSLAPRFASFVALGSLARCLRVCLFVYLSIHGILAAAHAGRSSRLLRGFHGSHLPQRATLHPRLHRVPQGRDLRLRPPGKEGMRERERERERERKRD